jgi:toxin FitB
VNYLLDTNVVSEWAKPRPDANVVEWLADEDEDLLCLSVITLAEIRFGLEQLPAGRRREYLSLWLQDELPARFEGRILTVDRLIADAWGTIMARTSEMGISLGVMDAFFAATAQAHDLTFVTRNTKHFEKVGIPLLNPWGDAL